MAATVLNPPEPRNVYTHGHHESVLRAHEWRTVANSAGYLLPELHPSMRILDVGAGTGGITAGLAELVAPGQVVGIDTVRRIVDRAAATFAAPNLRFEVGDVFELEYPDGSFDVVHAHQVLQHLDDPVEALRRLRRVVRPGGLIAVRDADYHGMFWYPDSDGLQAWMRVYQQVARSNRAEPDAGRRLLTWARSAGFVDITVSGSAWCYASADDRAWWSDTWAQRITDSPLAQQARQLNVATSEELVRIGAAWRAWGQAPDGFFVVPHGELLIRC